jgi:class 3 adenylate cyclase
MVGERSDRVERRLAAILAADAVGYSRLMGLDEAGTAAYCASIASQSMRWWSSMVAASSRPRATAF